jgi:PAS domain S-box-containing protein
MESGKREKGKPAKRLGMQRLRLSKPTSMGDISPSRTSSFDIQPEGLSLTSMLETLKPHDHLCLIYESTEEWRACVVPFISIGLKHGEKCIYIVDTSTAAEICKYLAEEGVDVAAVEKSGQLSILHETQAYTREGSFDPDKIIALLISETEKAITGGYTALRVTGEMTWVLRGRPGSEKLLEYEAKLNSELFSKYPCLSICQYDRWKFDPEIIKGVIMTHPLLVRGNSIYHNFYYVLPKEFLNRKRAETEVQHWLNNIEREQQIWETLRRSEQNFHDLIESLPLGVRVLDKEGGKTIYANWALLDMWGYSSIEELEAVPREHRYTPEGYNKHMKVLEKRKRGEHVPPSYETEIVRGDGQIRHVLMSRRELLWNGEKRFQVVYQDITERKRAEEILANEAARRRILVEQSRDGIVVLDENGKVYEANRRFAEMLGYSPEEVRELNVWDWEFQFPREQVQEMIRSVDEKGDHFETRHRRKDGSTYDVEISTNAAMFAGQKLIFCVCRDITERKRIEDALRESEERYRFLVELSPEAIFVACEGKHVFTNSVGVKLLGASNADQIIGIPVMNVIHPDYRGIVVERMQKAIETGIAPSPIEEKFIRLDGKLIDVEVRGSPLVYQGKPAMQVVVRDITERKQQEKERRKLEQKAQLASRLASVGEMAAGIAHEINNPLTSVIGYSQLLSGREDIPEDVKTDLRAIDEGAQRVAGIIKRLLTFSRQSKPERALVNINDLITNTLDLRAYHLRTNNIKVTTRLATDLPLTTADPAQLQQVFLNIIVNAETAITQARGRGKLLVNTEELNGTIRISFKDNGSGIAKKNLERIFDPFFTTKEVDKGTGLGLSICHGIVAEHKGRIWAESTLGSGATFIVELPIVTGSIQLEMAEPPGKKLRKMPKAKILLVDDELSTLELLSRLFTDEGHDVQTVNNADEALEMVKNGRYNLILLDIKMPGTNGIELYGRMQKIALSLAERVIFITGDVIGPDTENFLSRTKAPYITKPFDVHQLKKKVEHFLTGD